MLNTNLGNVQLYRDLADTYSDCQRVVDEATYDDLLWKAVEKAMKSTMESSKNPVLIVDGVDETRRGEVALLNRLHEAVSKSPSIRLISLGSQEVDSNVSQMRIQVSLGVIFDDIASVTRKILHQCHVFNGMSNDNQELTVARITEGSAGSFIWAKLISKRLRDEHSTDESAFSKSVDALVKAGYKVTDLISQTLESKLEENTKKILLWLATATRPLTQQELNALLSTQPSKATVAESPTIECLELLKPVASLVFVHSNVVYLRHAQMRAAILNVFAKGKFLPMIKNRDVDLSERLLLYTRHYVKNSHEPSLDPLDEQFIESVLEKYPLLDFSLRYWPTHVKFGLQSTDGQHITAAGKALRPFFSESITVPLLEMSIWKNKKNPELWSFHEIQTSLYRQILGSNHPATLQALLSQVLFCKSIYNAVPLESRQIFFEAVNVCNKTLSVKHLITMQVAQDFLDITSESVSESKTQSMVQRTEVLKILAECYKTHYGATSTVFISTMTQLADHYTAINEQTKAQKVTASIENTQVQSSSHQRKGSRQIDESLMVHLHGRKDIETTSSSLALDGIEVDALITQSFDRNALLVQAEQQTTNRLFAEAEQTYVEIWEQASQEYRANHSTEHKLTLLRSVLTYAQFLESQKRKSEAATVVAGFWEQYDTSLASPEVLVPHLLQLAQIMKSAGQLTLALEVYKHLALNTSSQSFTHKEAERLIQSTSQELMQSNTMVTETTLKEMVSHGSSAQKSTATSSLVELYLSQHRWHDATGVLKRLLREVWPTLFVPSLEEVTLPSSQVEHCIDLAEQLASCYRSRRRPAKEEDIRTRLYRALRRDRSASGDKVLDRVTRDLLRLYERTSQPERVIAIHQNILHDNIQRFGKEHPAVLQELWTLAGLTRPQSIAVDYYRQIVEFLNKDSETCHPDAFEPLLIVATELLKQGRYSDALKPCRVLFSTLAHPDISQKLGDQAFVRSIYENYVHCLRVARADITVIHDITSQYRKTCVRLFGTTASITIQATKTLANICQESTKYDAEAIQLYESLLQMSSSEVEIDHKGIRDILEAINEQHSASLTSSEVESLSSKDIRQLESIRTQRLTSVSAKYGWAHQESLSQIEEIVSLRAKQNNTEAAISLLEEATSHVLATETSSSKLIAAAKTIAASYIAVGQTQNVRALSDEIYFQVMIKNGKASNKLGIQSSNHRLALIFLAQLEYAVLESTSQPITLNELYAALTREYLHFEQFRKIIGSGTSKLQHTANSVAQLHKFLLNHGRGSAAIQVVEQYTSLFVSSEGNSLNIEPSHAKVFIEMILEYLSIHVSHDFTRSVAIATYNKVALQLDSGNYQEACNLASASTKYIVSQRGNYNQTINKLVFKLGLLIAGREMDAPPTASIKKQMLEISAKILNATLGYFKEHNVDITQLDLANINRLIKVLDDQHDYHTLAWVLTSLWDSRDAYVLSQPQHAYTLALGRMLVITRYLVGDYASSVRLAEDLVYNCARVHGPRHPSTVEITVLLSQMYTSMAQGYQGQKGRDELAYRYYRKAAALHENALRVFIDPSSDSNGDMDVEVISGMSSPTSPSSPTESEEGKYVRQHLHMLKLAIERLGDWPKEYSEYERLNHELFSVFENDLKGVEGIDKWNLQSFGSGKAEASDDLVSFRHEHLAIAI